MVLQSSGQISVLDVATEFGGSAPHSLSEYYAATAGIPSSGTLSLSDFYGKSSSVTFTLSSNQENWNLRSWALASGWDGTAQLVVNISSGVYVWSDTTSTAGLIISGAFPGGLIVNNSGFIMGRGGNGAIYTTGFPGGPGVTVSLTSGSATFNNQPSGYIGGGGGGGAATNVYYGGGGGAGGGKAGLNYEKAGGAIGQVGAGGLVGQSGVGGNSFNYGEAGQGISSAGGGAGGGGGSRDETGGDQTQVRGSAGGRIFPGTGGRGSAAGGYGGAGGSAGNAGVNGTGGDGNAGGGGGWGAAGGSAYIHAGGAGGAAISGSSYTVTGTTSQIYGSY